MKREIESLFKRAIATITPAPTAKDLLTVAHEGDNMLADLQTATRLHVELSSLDRFTDTIDNLMSDPQVRTEWEKLWYERLKKNREEGRDGVNGWEDFELWTQAARNLDKTE